MWTDPNGTTPSIVQIDFGPWGQDMPGDGYAYCGPTSMVMGLYYLYANGFTQLAPGPFVDQDNSATVNLERIIAGLCRTSRGTASGLSGPVSVNSGTIVVAGSGATGAGSVFVNSGATLEVIGSVRGAIQVAESGTLFLSGGTVEGDLNMATISDTGPAPGSILQGGGTLSGATTVNGMINSGPLTGLITFTNDVTIAGAASFTWTPRSLVDNSNSASGEGWNGLAFEATQSNVGADGQYVSFYLDFTQVGSDPDGGDPFWSSGHEWTLFNFAAHGGSCWWSPQNFSYVRGNFGLKWDGWTVCLTWTPAKKPQSLVERRTAEAAARAAPQAGRPDA
jgi:hypothetical protein